MRTVLCTWLMVSAMMTAQAVPALAQGVAAFDGNYAGVSRNLVSDTTRHRDCPPSGSVGALTIRGGAAQAQWAGGTYDGQVSSMGALSMRASNGSHFEGQITDGVIQGRSQSGLGKCLYDVTWRKQ
jgi:hypothetical protein